MQLNFQKQKRLIPTIVQDVKTNEILMLGYTNKQAFDKTVQTGLTWFWSRSRNRLWMKGEKSGNTMKVKEIFFDCDKDALLIKVVLQGKYVCHTRNHSCFFNKLKLT